MLLKDVLSNCKMDVLLYADFEYKWFTSEVKIAEYEYFNDKHEPSFIYVNYINTAQIVYEMKQELLNTKVKIINADDISISVKIIDEDYDEAVNNAENEIEKEEIKKGKDYLSFITYEEIDNFLNPKRIQKKESISVKKL